VYIVGNSVCALEREVGGFLMQRESRSIRCVGEGSEKGRRLASVKSCYSTMRWMEEGMVRRLRLGPASLHLYLFLEQCSGGGEWVYWA
jgi:hypothetical protein